MTFDYAAYRRKRRLDPEFRDRERKREAIRVAKKRKDPEVRAAYNAYQLEWQKRNPQKVQVHQNRRKNRLKNSGSVGVTLEEWTTILLKFEGKCAYCGNPGTSIDHVIPISKGGKDDSSNVVPACRRCNSSKGAKLLHEWKR